MEESTKNELGIVLYHLKDKYAFGIPNKFVSGFDFTEQQISLIIKFAREGAFEGMLNDLSADMYLFVLDLQYDYYMDKTNRAQMKSLLAKKLSIQDDVIKMASKNKEKEQ